MDALITTKLFILKGLILWYMNFTTIIFFQLNHTSNYGAKEYKLSQRKQN